MRRLSSFPCALVESAQRKLWWLWAIVFVRSPAQGLVEYSLILVLIMVVCITILSMVGRTTSELWYQKIIDAMPG